MFTPKQIAALRYLIFKSKDGNELAKRVSAFLIDRSEGLVKDVCITLVEGYEGYTANEIQGASSGFDSMTRSNRTTHINQILDAMGSDMGFSVHYGDFDPKRGDEALNCDGLFVGYPVEICHTPGLCREGMALRYTFWLSKGDYTPKADLVVVTRKDLEQIDLRKPGLYPDIEAL